MQIDYIKPAEKKARPFNLSWTVVRVGVTISILAYLGFKVNWAELGNQLMRANIGWLAVACSFLGITFLLASVRWWLLLRVQNIFLPVKTVAALILIGQFFNSFLLGSTGGDVVRALYVSKYFPSKKAYAMMTVIMDRAIGLFVLVCIALCGTSWQLRLLMQRQDTKDIAYALLIILGIMVGGAVSLAFIPFKRLPFFPHRLWSRVPKRDVIEALVAAFRQHGSSSLLTLGATACSVAIWVIVYTMGYCIALAINLKMTYLQVLVTLSIVSFVISLPISIGGHGVREGAFVAMFAAFGIITIDKLTGLGQEPAILFSILFYALFLVWSLVGGLVYLAYKGHTVEPYRNVS
jgi:glycosyltransferase 2 family protein